MAAAPPTVLAGAARAEAVQVVANMAVGVLEGGRDDQQFSENCWAHLDRLAVVYLRQSSMAQVREHTESTMRQYGLVEEAVAGLGPRGRTGDRHRPGGLRPVGRGPGRVRRAGVAGVHRRGRGDLR